jgi:hypothetical protein
MRGDFGQHPKEGVYMELLTRFTALNEGLAERDRIEVKQIKV